MQPRQRIDVGPPIAILGALLLLVSLFLDWYEPGVTAWNVFEVIDLALAAIALACLVAAAARLGLGVPGGRALSNRIALLGVLALVLVVSQVINHPPAAVDADPETGIWLGLGGAALLALGGLLSATRISFAVDVERRTDGAGASPASEPPARNGGETQTTPLDVPPHEREQR